MSVTITDILKLPSLQGAKVLAGHSNLDCIISSISVLESADGMEAVPGYARHYGQEILLTAFVAYKDDVDKQCNAIRLVHDEGEVGIILFYVGSVLPKVDQRVIDLSDELGMPKMMIQDYVSAYKNNFLVDIFDETVVVMADRKLELSDEDLQELLNELEENALKARVVIYNPTTTTKKVQEAYRQLQSFKKYVPIVFPKKSVITGGEIAFVGQAKELFDTQSYSSTLEDIMKLQLFTDKRQADLLETMEVFLLDGNMSVAKTAELMFTHKNTIQYRIKSLEGILGHKLTRIPEVYNLYTLAAINRLNKAI